MANPLLKKKEGGERERRERTAPPGTEERRKKKETTAYKKAKLPNRPTKCPFLHFYYCQSIQGLGMYSKYHF